MNRSNPVERFKGYGVAVLTEASETGKCWRGFLAGGRRRWVGGLSRVGDAGLEMNDELGTSGGSRGGGRVWRIWHGVEAEPCRERLATVCT